MGGLKNVCFLAGNQRVGAEESLDCPGHSAFPRGGRVHPTYEKNVVSEGKRADFSCGVIRQTPC